MHYVYVLWNQVRCEFYVGFTSDLKRRLAEHMSDKVHTTKRYESLRLIFYEAFSSKSDAIRREQYLKTSKGKKTLRLMLRESTKAETKTT